MRVTGDREGCAHGRDWTGRPFSLDRSGRTLAGRVAGHAAPLVERFLALDALNRLYDRICAGPREMFFDRVLDDLRIAYGVDDADLARIPPRGPLVVVANHPFGAIEGIILGALVRRVRPDTRVMANFLLGRIPELRESFILVDPFGSPDALRRNSRPMREAIRWVEGGGVLAAFPAGEVAHLTLADRCVCEPAWSTTVARLVRRTEAPVLPVYFDGRNGPLFQLAGLIHPRLRTALLPRQVFRQAGSTVDVRIGGLIPSKRLAAMSDDSAVTQYLRQRVLLLRHRVGAPAGTVVPKTRPQAPVSAAVDPASLASEVDRLPTGQVLVDAGEHRVCIAKAAQIPFVLGEIARLREITYRASGEGTGKPLDTDDFDAWYLHLFLWDAASRQVLGAYRLGQTDQLLEARGPRGLYTSTLFEFAPRLLASLNPSLELGRAFIRAEHQRSYAALMLIWKGIARYVCMNPQYKTLFGPVSISNDYGSASRELLIRFLRSHHWAGELTNMARARNPFRESGNRVRELGLKRLAVHGDDAIDDLVSDLEPDGKGVPVLLRQYIKLGARFLSFNVDRAFGDAIDALMFVDLTRTDRRILDRYMGRDAARQFLAHHDRSVGRMVAAASN